MTTTPSTARATELPSDGTLLRLTFILVSGALLALVSTTTIGVALPFIGADLDASVSQTGWAGTAYVLALAAAIGASGWASVRFGLRRTWLAALGVFAVGAALTTLAPTIEVLIAGRAVQGLGGGMLEPVMLTAIARAAGPSRMGRAMGVVSGAIALGPLLGPLLGGGLVEVGGWRWLFGAFVPLAAASWVLSLRLLPTDRGRAEERLDLSGLLLLIGGLIAVLVAISYLGGAVKTLTLGIGVLGLAVLGLGLLGAYVAHARHIGLRAVAPLAPLRTSGFAPAVATFMLLGAAIYPLFVGMPQFFQDTLGYGPFVAGILLVPHGLGALVTMMFGSRLSDHYDPRVIAGLGALAAAVGSGAYLLLGTDAPLAGYLLASLLTGAGTGLVGGPTIASMYRVLAPEHIAAGSTLVFVLNQVGGAFGIAILTLIIAAGDPTGWTAQVGMTPMFVPLVGSVAILALVPRLPKRDA